MLGFSDSQSPLNTPRRDSEPRLNKCRKRDNLLVRKKPIKKRLQTEYCRGNVVSYVVIDSWTKHNQFTTKCCCIVTKFIEMSNNHKMTCSVLADHTHLLGPTATAQISLLDYRRIANSLPPPECGPPQQRSNATGLDHTDPTRTVLAV